MSKIDNPPAVITDHGALTGLTDDDHTQYALLAGRSGGQTLIGGTGTTDDLILRSTSGVGATGADIIFQVGNNGATEAMRILNSGFVGIGMTPTVPFHVNGSAKFTAPDTPTVFLNVYTDSGSNQIDLNAIGGGSLALYSTAKVIFRTSGADPAMTILNAGNVGIGTTTPGGGTTIGTSALSLANGTAPVGGVANQASLYSADITAGNAALHVLNENGEVIKLHKANTYTQTYATADRTLGAYTSDPESGAYTGIDNLQVGTPYAQLTDLNALRVAYETLRVFTEDAVAMLNATVDDLQTIGLVG